MVPVLVTSHRVRVLCVTVLDGVDFVRVQAMGRAEVVRLAAGLDRECFLAVDCHSADRVRRATADG